MRIVFAYTLYTNIIQISAIIFMTTFAIIYWLHIAIRKSYININVPDGRREAIVVCIGIIEYHNLPFGSYHCYARAIN